MTGPIMRFSQDHLSGEDKMDIRKSCVTATKNVHDGVWEIICYFCEISIRLMAWVSSLQYPISKIINSRGQFPPYIKTIFSKGVAI